MYSYEGQQGKRASYLVVDNVQQRRVAESIIPNVNLLTKLGGKDASAYYQAWMVCRSDT